MSDCYNESDCYMSTAGPLLGNSGPAVLPKSRFYFWERETSICPRWSTRRTIVGESLFRVHPVEEVETVVHVGQQRVTEAVLG